MNEEEVVGGFEDLINPQYARIIDPEINKHDRMKILGRKILYYMGIPQSSIEEEVTVDCDGKTYRIDLIGTPLKYGKHTDFKIAIEYGDNKAEKIEAMKRTFPLVLILPYKEFDYQDLPEIKAIKKLTDDLAKETTWNHHHLREIERTRMEVGEILKKMKDETKKDMENFKKDYINQLKGIDDGYKKHRRDLENLEQFRTFCEGFGKGSIMGIHYKRPE